MSRVSPFVVRRARELYPSLARAVPPVPLETNREEPPLRCGEYPHVVANYFWRDHVNEARLHVCATADAVIGPIRAVGSCLAPLHTPGDEMFFDPTLPARHGDVVLFQAPDDWFERDESPLGLTCKLVVEFADEYFLAFRDGMFPLGDIQILGVEVRRPSLLAVPAAEGIERVS